MGIWFPPYKDIKTPPKVTLDQILDYETIRFEIGLDGLPYAVFTTNCYSWEYAELVSPHIKGAIAHFGNYENAVCLQDTIGL